MKSDDATDEGVRIVSLRERLTRRLEGSGAVFSGGKTREIVNAVMDACVAEGAYWTDTRSEPTRKTAEEWWTQRARQLIRFAAADANIAVITDEDRTALESIVQEPGVFDRCFAGSEHPGMPPQARAGIVAQAFTLLHAPDFPAGLGGGSS